jgi:uncharacterized membrane protein
VNYQENKFSLSPDPFPFLLWMNKRNHLVLLWLWLVLGIALRFLRLASLPPWTDECATIAFSLGNGFNSVPLNQLLSADVLLQPLHPNTATGIGSVIQSLFGESTHPPVYFILTHLWMKVFSPSPELASIWAARSLSAILGIISIPAMFALGYFTFRSTLVGNCAAAMMAISPYVVFLGREARHYTLAMLLIIASLSCLLKALRDIHAQKSLPGWIVLAWIVINTLGVATHYFFVISLAAQGLVCLWLIWQQWQNTKSPPVQIYWQKIWLVALGTLGGCLVWLPILPNIYGSEPTTWVNANNSAIAPIARLLLWLMSMLVLLPSAFQIFPLAIVVISGVITLLFLLLAIPKLISGIQTQQQEDVPRIAIGYLTIYIICAIALCLFFTYILGMDLTLAARFQFIYAPAVILLLAAGLAGCWQRTKKTASIIGIMAFLGGITVVWNGGYLQNQRPDILATIIQNQSQVPVLIATTHKHHGQTGRIMGLAWEKQKFPPSPDWQYFLIGRHPVTKDYNQGIEVLKTQLSQLPQPLDLWLVEFSAQVDFSSQNCFPEHKSRQSAGEYRYQLYHCGVRKNS